MLTPVPTLGVLEFFGLLRGGATLIDVREPHEFSEIHARGAVSMPLNSVPDHVEEFSDHAFANPGHVAGVEGQSKPLYVICRSGARSHAACEWLIAQGINAVNIVGGTLGWIAAELPIDTTEINETE